MDRDFERFHGGANEAASKRVHVTISPAKLILLNRNMYNTLGRPAAVYLNFSRVRDTIAIEPASPRLPETFPVIKSGAGWRINSAPFCRHFGIVIDTTLKFVHPEIAGNALYLKLNETISVGGRKGKKK
jgi:hypothetical protein